MILNKLKIIHAIINAVQQLWKTGLCQIVVIIIENKVYSRIKVRQGAWGLMVRLQRIKANRNWTKLN